MKAIVAVSRDWGIGRENRLLFSIREDMRFFKETTTGHVVVMGRKTLESFPGGLPLKNRVNIVLTRTKDYDGRGAIVVHSVEEMKEILQQYASEEIFVIGGASVYRALMPETDTVHVTKVDAEAEADAFFPNLDEDPGWQMTKESEEKEQEGLRFRFTTYERMKEYV